MTSGIVIQATAWHAFDRTNDDEDSDSKSAVQNQFTVLIFGTSADHSNICLQVQDFTPYFYVELPRVWFKSEIDYFNDYIAERLSKNMKDEYLIDKTAQLERFSFSTFQDGIKKPFLRLRFKSIRCFYRVRSILQKPITMNGLRNGCLPILETNILPLLRLIHQTDVLPSGWIKASEYSEPEVKFSKYEHEYTVNWKNIKPFEDATIGPLRILAWDIEADSSHGDFPLAKKDYTTLANDLRDLAFTTLKAKCLRYENILEWLEYAFRNGRSQIDYNDDRLLQAITNVYLRNKSYYENIDLESAASDIYKELKNIQISGSAKVIRESRQAIAQKIKKICNYRFPSLQGDKIIQIGATWQILNDKKIHKYIATLGSCDKLDGCEVEECPNEESLIAAFARKVASIQPHIITGYNIFGFDFKFLWERAEELGCTDLLSDLSIYENHEPELICKELQSSALGQNKWYYPDLPGINSLDIMKIIQRDHNLTSYSLDSVSSEFINSKINSFEHAYKDNKEVTLLHTSSTEYVNVDDYISVYHVSAIGRDILYSKCIIVGIDANTIILGGNYTFPNGAYWGLAKDDVSPKDIFRLQKGSSSDRAIIAKYCIKDCELCLSLLKKLELITNNVAMANVCLVPLSFLFTRGQMIKTLSLVSKECMYRDYLIPLLTPKQDEDEHDSYEGAIVLPPKRGIYIDETVSVVDYGSLYPSSMISHNLSHDTWVTQDHYQGNEGKKILEEKGYEVHDISYDNYKLVKKGKAFVKVIDENCKRVTNRFVCPQNTDGKKIDDSQRGILPQILLKLLSARKATRAKMKTEKDPFKINVLEGQQLAYKLTANSLYGGVGANVSALHCKAVAASTTATGRNMLYHARDFTLANYPEATITYGDTDSLFVNFHPKNEMGEYLKGEENLRASIALGQELEKAIQPTLPFPHKLEYEKSAYPLILLRKKGYVFRKYEEDPTKWKLVSMGVVTKRRDNPPIVKLIYSGVVDRIMQDKSVYAAAKFVQEQVRKVCNGEYTLDHFVVSKSLKSTYKNPEQIVHKVLADRMAERDPGNAPKSNDRIPYAFIEVSHKVTLQGEKVEHPSFIKENNLKVDYIFYITNHVAKPVSQIFALAIDEMRPFGYNRPVGFYDQLASQLRSKLSQTQIDEKIQTLKAKDVMKTLFDPIIVNYRRNGQNKMPNFFGFRPFVQLQNITVDNVISMPIENDGDDDDHIEYD